jgi:hypothetical protein
LTAGRVVRVDPTRDPRWDEFVSAHPEGRVCDTSAWLEILGRTFGYEPVHLAYEVNGALDGVLPLCRIRSPLTGARLVSLPFSGPAGPIGSVEAVERLVAEATRAMTDLGCGYLNVRSSHASHAGAFRGFTSVTPFVSSRVLLERDPREMWRRIPIRSVRQEINSGQRRGVSFRVAESKDDLRTFYRLFIETSRKHGIPPQPWRMFDLMWDLLWPRRILHLFLTALNGHVLTAQLCFVFRDVMSAGYVGTDYRFLGHHPVKIADWGALSWACREGYRVYDFLQSHVQNRGLRWYKKSFGAVELPVAYYYYPGTDPTAFLREALIGRSSPIAAGVKALVRRLPNRGLRLLGELTYRHMG